MEELGARSADPQKNEEAGIPPRKPLRTSLEEGSEGTSEKHFVIDQGDLIISILKKWQNLKIS